MLILTGLACFSGGNDPWLLPGVVCWWALTYCLISEDIPHLFYQYTLETEVRQLYAKFFKMDVSKYTTEQLHKWYDGR